MSSKTLCEELADYVVSAKFAMLPAPVVEKAKQVFLHNLAICFGGAGTEQVNKAIELVKTRAGAATIVAQPFKADAADAAFVNTIGMRALRMEDTHVPSFAHPGACLVPTALAFAEQEGLDGQEVLTAVTVGYDVIGKLAGSLYTWDHGNRTPSHIWGALGVAAVAAKLLRLDLEQTTGALAHACNLGALITNGIQDFQYGILTRNGIFAAMLGRSRAPFPTDALEGPHGLYAVQLRGARPTTQEILGSLGSQYEIMTAVLKPHPCTGCNLVPIEIFRRLLRQHDLSAADISSIRVIRSRALGRPTHHSKGPFNGYLNGMYAATSSLPFALAALLAHGELQLAFFQNPNDPRIAAGLHKISVEYRDGMGLLDHEVEIGTSAGKRFQLRGAAEYLPPPNASAILETYARPVVGAAKITQLARHIMAFESAANMQPLAGCLV